MKEVKKQIAKEVEEVRREANKKGEKLRGKKLEINKKYMIFISYLREIYEAKI
jgi:hypothetical protein